MINESILEYSYMCIFVCFLQRGGGAKLNRGAHLFQIIFTPAPVQACPCLSRGPYLREYGILCNSLVILFVILCFSQMDILYFYKLHVLILVFSCSSVFYYMVPSNVLSFNFQMTAVIECQYSYLY